ncbi:uncharacterized protein BDZ99DRAFT_532565, partial [Mytilinidion resinicola]
LLVIGIPEAGGAAIAARRIACTTGWLTLGAARGLSRSFSLSQLPHTAWSCGAASLGLVSLSSTTCMPIPNLSTLFLILGPIRGHLEIESTILLSILFPPTPIVFLILCFHLCHLLRQLGLVGFHLFGTLDPQLSLLFLMVRHLSIEESLKFFKGARIRTTTAGAKALGHVGLGGCAVVGAFGNCGCGDCGGLESCV